MKKIEEGQNPTRADALDYLAWLMDQAIRIPGTNIKVGVDALLGLFPFGGEVITAIIQSGLVLMALSQNDVPKTVAARMILNVAIDSAFGAIPIMGDVFDIFFKANTRNLALLRRVQEEKRRMGRASARPHVAYLACVALALFAILAALIIGIVTMLRWAFR